MAASAFVSLYIIVSKMVETALQIADKIQRGEVQPDVAAITELLSKQPTGTSAELLNFAGIVLILSWIIGIADAYRVGRIQGKDDAQSGK